MAPHLSEEELAATLPPGVPIVLLNTRGQERLHPTISLDNAAGATAVAEHLLALGRSQVLHLAGPPGNADAQERAQAFAARMAQGEGVALTTVQGDFSEQSGEAAVAALLKSNETFDAVFAANDNMAIGALQALRQAGRQVPEAVAVAGFDDIPMARHLGLTTVRVRIAELGESSLSELLDTIEGRGTPPASTLHPVELVVRTTTGQA
jgi:LacI family transcriptional regulator